MSPVSSAGETTFSPCSIGNICEHTLGLVLLELEGCLYVSFHIGSVLVGSVNSTCLQDADTAKQTISLQMCGNGIVEAGEGAFPANLSSKLKLKLTHACG